MCCVDWLFLIFMFVSVQFFVTLLLKFFGYQLFSYNWCMNVLLLHSLVMVDQQLFKHKKFIIWIWIKIYPRSEGTKLIFRPTQIWSFYNYCYKDIHYLLIFSQIRGTKYAQFNEASAVDFARHTTLTGLTMPSCWWKVKFLSSSYILKPSSLYPTPISESPTPFKVSFQFLTKLLTTMLTTRLSGSLLQFLIRF